MRHDAMRKSRVARTTAAGACLPVHASMTGSTLVVHQRRLTFGLHLSEKTTHIHTINMDAPPRPSSSLFDVFLRLRPSNSTNARFLTVEESERDHPTHITIQPPTNTNDKRKRAVERFAFTRVFEEDAQQMHLFKGTGIVQMIEGVMGEPGHRGRDGLFATLGCSGSGKVCCMICSIGALCTNTLLEPHNSRNQDPAWSCPDDT
jgi:hypothetical protein